MTWNSVCHRVWARNGTAAGAFPDTCYRLLSLSLAVGVHCGLGILTGRDPLLTRAVPTHSPNQNSFPPCRNQGLCERMVDMPKVNHPLPPCLPALSDPTLYLATSQNHRRCPLLSLTSHLQPSTKPYLFFLSVSLAPCLFSTSKTVISNSEGGQSP